MNALAMTFHIVPPPSPGTLVARSWNVAADV
jgi:hypothetical protein